MFSLDTLFSCININMRELFVLEQFLKCDLFTLLSMNATFTWSGERREKREDQMPMSIANVKPIMCLTNAFNAKWLHIFARISHHNFRLNDSEDLTVHQHAFEEFIKTNHTHKYNFDTPYQMKWFEGKANIPISIAEICCI